MTDVFLPTGCTFILNAAAFVTIRPLESLTIIERVPVPAGETTVPDVESMTVITRHVLAVSKDREQGAKISCQPVNVITVPPDVDPFDGEIEPTTGNPL
jgi:hypothetical protein